MRNFKPTRRVVCVSTVLFSAVACSIINKSKARKSSDPSPAAAPHSPAPGSPQPPLVPPSPVPPLVDNNGPLEANVVPFTVNGKLCGDPKLQYPNQPCTSVTICQPGTSSCQTINNIVLDTGSSGLRLFASVVKIATTPVSTAAGGRLTECMSYTGLASDWGPIALVDVKLGGEPSIQVPVQLIDSTYATPPPLCTAAQTTPDLSPEQAGFNGILGVSMLVEDCGIACTTNAQVGIYYSCSGDGSCVGTTSAVQLQNPVALLPTDNNGVVFRLNSVPATGIPNADGQMILGIGTRPNNSPTAGIVTLAANTRGEISSTYPGGGIDVPLRARFDSGSPEMVLPAGTVPICLPNTRASGYLCPSDVVNATATMYGNAKTASTAVTFNIANAAAVLESKAVASSGLASALSITSYSSAVDSPFTVIDWGLPFFFGRSIYFGFEDRTSTLGKGPYYGL